MQALLQSFLCWVVASYIRLVYYTSQKTIMDTDALNAQFASGKPMILAFWHGRLLLMPMFNKHPRPVHVLISRHRDGELIARTIAHFKLQVIRGSSNRKKGTAQGAKDRGGVTALRMCLDKIEQGDSICITPDGPKGPAEKVKGTILDLARLTGIPILPVSHSQSWRRRLGTWDRFQIPLPFSTLIMIAGTPITVPKDADEAAMETARQALEDSLNALTKRADLIAGHSL